MYTRLLLLLVVLTAHPVSSILAPRATLPPDVRFQNGPKVGERVPDVTIVDDQGRPVSIRELAPGQYTVMTLGCLTLPPFLANVPSSETVERHYADTGVKFFYVYKPLAHAT